MAKLVFGMNLSLDGYVDHLAFAPGRALFRHFIAEAEGFRARPITPGRLSGGRTEIISGLVGDERIAGTGAFLLKAELGKGEAEHDH